MAFPSPPKTRARGPAPPRIPARGSCRRDDPQRLNPQIVARFDRETFDEIAAYAASKGLSFNAALLVLTTWGLMAARREVP